MKMKDVIENADIVQGLYNAVKLNITPQNYIKLLKDKGKLQLLSCNQFCNRIRQALNDQPKFIKNFQQQFQLIWHKDKNRVNYYFPFVKQHDKKILQINLQRFIKQYMKFDDSLVSWQFQTDQAYLNKNSSEESQRIANYDFKRVRTQVEKQEINNVNQKNENVSPNPNVKKDQKVNEVDTFLEIDFDFRPWVPQCQERPISQKITTKSIEINDIDESFQKYQIPKYFLDHNIALSTLLGINLSEYFQNELEQVKTLIKQQILDNSITQFYISLLRQYLQYKYICEGQSQKVFQPYKEKLKDHITQMRDYFSNPYSKICYGFGGKESAMMNSWKTIFNNMTTKVSSNEIYEQSVRNHLLNGLNSVYLVFNFEIGKQNHIYGYANNMGISVNVNVLAEGVKFQQFRQGPLKPYIAMTIYHELGNYLIRSAKQTQVNSSGISFNYVNQTIGTQIIDFVKMQCNLLPSYLKIAEVQFRERGEMFENIEKTAESIIAILEKHKSIFAHLKVINSQLNELKSIIATISTCFRNTKVAIQKPWTIEQWERIFIYIDKLKNNVSIKTSKSQVDEFRYKYFFSIFLTSQIVSQFLNQKIKSKYLGYCQILRNLQLKVYFLQKDTFIEQILKLILAQNNTKNGISQLKQIYQCYSSLIFEDHAAIQTLNDKITQFTYILESDAIESQLTQVEYLFTESVKQSNFPNFKVGLVYDKELNQHNNLDRIFKNIYNLKRVIKVQQSYEMMMNFIKFSQILKILFTVPSFFTHGLYDYKSIESKKDNMNVYGEGRKPRNLQSGFDIQRRIFPEIIKSQRIFAKDYELMKRMYNIDDRLEIGKIPACSEAYRLSVSVRRQGNIRQEGVNLRGRVCANQFYSSKQSRAAKMQRYFRRLASNKPT